MLKIKDDVDLKELEKFGFRRKVDSGEEVSPIPMCLMPLYKIIFYHFECESGEINIHEKRENNHFPFGFEPRELNIYIYSFDDSINNKIFDVLFDLIQSGLIEKVEAQDGSVGD